jgi:ribosomal protein L11 methyltransferase
VAITIPLDRAEQARAMMLQLFPEGFEESEEADGVELVAYTDGRGEERLWHVFGTARATPIAQDWAERWRSFHRPVEVGPVWIGPPWIDPPPDAIAVVIEPGRAFGTGAHPTTRLTIELLLALERGSLLDIGCGSGVVAVAAAKLGFEPVLALDVDPVAVETTRANAAANHVAVETEVRDAVAALGGMPSAAVAVANIAVDAVVSLAEHVRSERLISSGYLIAEEPHLLGFRRVERRQAEGWAADLWHRN